MQKNRNWSRRGQGEIVGILVFIVIVLLVCWGLSNISPGPHRKHVKIEKLKNGRYCFDDNSTGTDVWWYFDSGSSGSVVKNSNGTLTFPKGGSWIRGSKPDEDEELEQVEEVDEANIAEDPTTGDVEADATADASAGIDGAGDSGGDGGGGDGGGSD